MSRSTGFLLVTGALLLAAVVAVSLAGGGRRPTPLPVLRQVGSFSVTNQANAPVTSGDLRGRDWAINLIFTRCPGPCAQLSQVMRSIQDGLPRDADVGLMSVTSDPEFDTPAVLSAYARRFGADTNRWQFVTGSKDAVRKLVIEELLLVLVEKPEDQRETADDLFLHSTLIVVMDKQGRLRNAIEGLEPGAATKVLATLRDLERED